MKNKSITQEAHAIINGPRRQAYGHASKSFQRIANVWTEILGSKVTPHQVALCMIGLKLLRESNKPARDNRVDICGYAELADQLDA